MHSEEQSIHGITNDAEGKLVDGKNKQRSNKNNKKKGSKDRLLDQLPS